MATLITCGNCYHRRSFHKKADGNLWCSVQFCACKQFVEAKVPANRRAIVDAFNQFLDGIFGSEPPPKE